MIFKYTSSTHRHQDHTPLFSSMQPQLPNQENHILFHQVLKSKFNSEFPSFQPSALHVLITDYFSPLLTSETPADNSHSCAQHFITAARFLYQPLHFLDFSFAVWSIYLNPSRYFFSSSHKDIHLKAWTENDEASISAPCKNLLQLAMFSSFYPHDALWCERSLWPVWVTCPGSAPSYLPVPLSPSLWGQDKKLRCPCLCSAAQQQLKLRCVINGIISGRFLPSLPKGKVLLPEEAFPGWRHDP